MHTKVSRCYCDNIGGAHAMFHDALKKNKTILRKDKLNNVEEELTREILIERHGCICGIVFYGYTNLSIKIEEVPECRTVVKLTYFKKSGKYYTEGEYESTEIEMYKIYDEIKRMRVNGPLPGLSGRGLEFTIHVDCPNSDKNVPALIF